MIELATIEEMLASEDREVVRRGLELAKEEIARRGSDAAQPLFEVLSTLFYIDPLDRPDLKPCLDEALNLVIGFGEAVIPYLLDHLDDSDVKAQIVVANALGRIGADAVHPLLEAYDTTDDPDRRSFILYALGHVRSPRVRAALPMAVEAAMADHNGLRDSATRSLGRMLEWIPPEDLDPELKERLLEVLRLNLADPSPGIRSKAVRSLGKAARHGHLDHDQCAWLRGTLECILGMDSRHEWDRAYIVRREAREAMLHCPEQNG